MWRSAAGRGGCCCQTQYHPPVYPVSTESTGQVRSGQSLHIWFVSRGESSKTPLLRGILSHRRAYLFFHSFWAIIWKHHLFLSKNIDVMTFRWCTSTQQGFNKWEWKIINYWVSSPTQIDNFWHTEQQQQNTSQSARSGYSGHSIKRVWNQIRSGQCQLSQRAGQARLMPSWIESTSQVGYQHC